MVHSGGQEAQQSEQYTIFYWVVELEVEKIIFIKFAFFKMGISQCDTNSQRLITRLIVIVKSVFIQCGFVSSV